MPDMLVKLYELPDYTILLKELEDKGIRIIRPMTPNKIKVIDFVKRNFHEHWAGECDVSFSSNPVSAVIAVSRGNEIIGFACYEATCRSFFGPTGVLKHYRGQGIGKALLMSSLHGLREMGYAYAIIGGPDEAAGFYRKTVNAFVIPDSTPGIYKDLI